MSGHIYGAKAGECKCARCDAKRAAGTLPRKEFRNKRITDGLNHWTVSGTVRGDTVHVTELHGDVTDLQGIRNALRPFIQEMAK